VRTVGEIIAHEQSTAVTLKMMHDLMSRQLLGPWVRATGGHGLGEISKQQQTVI